MALKAPPIKNGEPSDPIKAGTYTAICYGVIDEGHQQATNFNGEAEVQHQIRLMFELPDERMGDGRPRGTSKKMKLSMHEKSGLRKAVHALIVKQLSDAEAVGFDLTSLVGRGCFVSIVENPRRDGNGTYSKIDGFMPLPRGVQVGKPENATIVYEVESGEPPDILPEWLRNEINQSEERAKGGASPIAPASSPGRASLPPPPARTYSSDDPDDPDGPPF